MAASADHPHFVTLGMFIIDNFSFLDDQGLATGKHLDPQIGGGGTYASIGARIWLSADRLGMVVDRGHDFPDAIQQKLLSYGQDMWLFRDNPDCPTTCALNSYRGDHRGFEYLTPRIRITPHDLVNTRLERSRILHFICSPSRAAAIMSEVQAIDGWLPITIYEPIPDRCIPQELPALIAILPSISILSPNAEEALSILSMPLPATKPRIEEACAKLLEFGIGSDGNGSVIIRSGGMGAYVATRSRGGKWIDAFWNDASGKVVEVTGAGNSFLGGLAAGLVSTEGNVYEAVLYATVSASFTIEQEGLPHMTRADNNGEAVELWNGDSPERRLGELVERHAQHN
ncbi:hypothetical protein JAAARDRAFT_64637 [Jaapia argillacea MUCL 33604]|uniref:Carbohydrate kinase PfkB domain-containing protein n=1 Tax=Jaapia argillacea MUCL 33604 TaxID=933084 RepID=A0A067QMP8_9AGAM|nr:hypothetical protein JAAARDRAFT_64637 [Jaapia argillacea MUCL 33604]